MAFTITITDEAERQLRWLSVREQRMLEDALPARLTISPTTPTRAIKRLRPNPLAQFELRVAHLRALYNVEGNEIVVLIVGRKDGNKLVVEGEEYHGHQNDPTEPPGDGASEDTGGVC
jgi:mRNA-degrading endonuclease RelE of RelBE toxin-antitoxin system